MGYSGGQRNIFWSCLKNILEKNGPRYWWTIWRPIWLRRWSELRQQMSSFHPPPPWALSQKGKHFFVKGTYISYVSKTVFGVTVVTWTSQCLRRFYHRHNQPYLYFLLSNSMRFLHFLLWQWQRGPMVPQSGFYHQLSTTAVYSPQLSNVWYQMLDLVC